MEVTWSRGQDMRWGIMETWPPQLFFHLEGCQRKRGRRDSGTTSSFGPQPSWQWVVGTVSRCGAASSGGHHSAARRGLGSHPDITVLLLGPFLQISASVWAAGKEGPQGGSHRGHGATGPATPSPPTSQVGNIKLSLLTPVNTTIKKKKIPGRFKILKWQNQTIKYQVKMR